MIFEWMEDSLMLYDEIHEVARNSELNRRQREHSFTYWRKSTTFHPLEVQLCDREFNYKSNDRWRDFQFITVCEIRRKQVCISLDDDQYAVSGFPIRHIHQYGVLTLTIRRIDPWIFQKPYLKAPIRHIDQYAVSDFPIRRIDPRMTQKSHFSAKTCSLLQGIINTAYWLTQYTVSTSRTANI